MVNHIRGTARARNVYGHNVTSEKKKQTEPLPFWQWSELERFRGLVL